MSTPPKAPPRTHQMLSRWAEVYARQVGHDAARVRRWVAYMALGGALARETVEGSFLHRLEVAALPIDTATPASNIDAS